MARLLSDRAEKTADVVVLAASLEDPNNSPPGVYRIVLLATCVSIFALFASLIIAYLLALPDAPILGPDRSAAHSVAFHGLHSGQQCDV